MATTNNLNLGEFLGFEPQLAEVNKWMVKIPTNQASIDFMCEQISFPGKTLVTNELSRTYGPYTKMPYAYLYNDIMMTFKCSISMKEKDLFDNWQKQAIGFNNECSFYYDYVKDVTIHQLDRQGNITHTVVLYECYPSAITELPLDYNVDNTYNRLNVTLTYYSWGKGKIPEATSPRPIFNPRRRISPSGIVPDAAGGDFTTV